jgi:cytochrome d ubiquinol oxidase subunit II
MKIFLRSSASAPAYAPAYTPSYTPLFTGYSVLAGVTAVCMSAFHGATYLTLRTVHDLRERAGAAARRLAVPAAILVIGFLVWTVLVAHNRNSRGILPTAIPAALTAAAVILAVVLTYARREGAVFVMTVLAILGTVATVFTACIRGYWFRTQRSPTA